MNGACLCKGAAGSQALLQAAGSPTLPQGPGALVEQRVRPPLPAFESHRETSLFGWKKKKSQTLFHLSTLSLKVAKSLWLAGRIHGPPACVRQHAAVPELIGVSREAEVPCEASQACPYPRAGAAASPACQPLLRLPTSREPSPPDITLFGARGGQRKGGVCGFLLVCLDFCLFDCFCVSSVLFCFVYLIGGHETMYVSGRGRLGTF